MGNNVRFTSYGGEVLETIQEKINKALEICGGTAERYAKENLTRNHSVDTGRLRGSIAHRQVDDKTEAVGTNVDYAPYVELGHTQEPGRYVPAIKRRLVRAWVDGKPYLRPAVEGHRTEYNRIIQEELKV